MSLPFEPDLALESSAIETPKVVRNDFGDGYSQRAVDGINNINEEWELQFDNLNGPRYSQLLTFLRSKGGHTTFSWTPPNDVEKDWVATTWTATPVGSNGGGSITVSIKREFDL